MMNTLKNRNAGNFIKSVRDNAKLTRKFGTRALNALKLRLGKRTSYNNATMKAIFNQIKAGRRAGEYLRLAATTESEA